MTDDVPAAAALLDPDSPDWIGVGPDGYVVQPCLLGIGCAPNPGPTVARTESQIG